MAIWKNRSTKTAFERAATASLVHVPNPSPDELREEEKRLRLIDHITGRLPHIDFTKVREAMADDGNHLVHIDLKVKQAFFGPWAAHKLGIDWVDGNINWRRLHDGTVELFTHEHPSGGIGLSHFSRSLHSSGLIDRIEAHPEMQRFAKLAQIEKLATAVQALPVSGTITTYERAPEATSHMHLLLTVSREAIRPIRGVVAKNDYMTRISQYQGRVVALDSVMGDTYSAPRGFGMRSWKRTRDPAA